MAGSSAAAQRAASDARTDVLDGLVGDLVGDTVGVTDRWVGLDPDTLTTAEAGEAVQALDRQVNRLQSARSKLAASFARREGHRRSGHKDLAHWMQDRLRRSPTQARKEARTAERLAGLRSTSDALDRGEISLEHAAAIAEQAPKLDDPEGAQRSLLAEARTGDPRRVRKAGRRMRRDADRRAEENRRYRRAKQQRTITFRADDAAKTMWIEGRLAMIDGVELRAAVDALAAPRGRDDDRSYGQRLADGLVELAKRAEDGRGLPSQGGLPVHVMAVTPVEALERRAGVPAGTICGVPGGGIDLSDAELAELVERADLSWLIVDPAGEPLRFGKGRRYASPEQRLVLNARDGGCAWPRCDSPAVWTMAHHEPPFDEPGGATDIATQVRFCGSHHDLRHNRGWTVQLDRSGTITVTSPDGRTTITETAAERRARHGTWELTTVTDRVDGDAVECEVERGATAGCSTRRTVGADRDQPGRVAREAPGAYRPAPEPAAEAWQVHRARPGRPGSTGRTGRAGRAPPRSPDGDRPRSRPRDGPPLQDAHGLGRTARPTRRR